MNMLNSYQSKSYLKLIFLFCIVFDTSIYHSQTLTDFEQREIEKINEASKKLKESGALITLNLLPNVSYNFNNDTWNLGINLGNLTTFFQRKKRNKIEIARFQQLAFQELGQKLVKLRADSIEIATKEFDYKQDSINFSTYRNLFELKRKQYQKNIIPAEDYLLLEFAYKTKVSDLQTKRNQIERLKYLYYERIKKPENFY